MIKSVAEFSINADSVLFIAPSLELLGRDPFDELFDFLLVAHLEE